MTSNESFKQRVRARMATTGERYMAARRVLIEQAERRADTARADGRRPWVSAPELSDDAVREATGAGWDEWVDVLEASPVADADHTAAAAWLADAHELPSGWWVQTVVVGWERITGRRLPGQMADGTFTVSRTRTMDLDTAALRAMLLDDEGRRALFPDLEPTLRSRPSAKHLRVGLTEGVVLVALDPREDGRTSVTVSHERLSGPEQVELWREHWGDWLEALSRAARR